jgi:hypothetical protein
LEQGIAAPNVKDFFSFEKVGPKLRKGILWAKIWLFFFFFFFIISSIHNFEIRAEVTPFLILYTDLIFLVQPLAIIFHI